MSKVIGCGDVVNGLNRCISKFVGCGDVVTGLNHLMLAVWALPAVLLYSKPKHTAVLSSLLVDDNAFGRAWQTIPATSSSTIWTFGFLGVT